MAEPEKELPKKIRIRATLEDGTKVEFEGPPADAPDEVKRSWRPPYVFVNHETRLPAMAEPIQIVADLIKAAGPERFAKDVGLPLEDVTRILKDGHDPKTQWRGRIPVMKGEVVLPRGGVDDVTMLALHEAPNGAVVFMADWAEGERLNGSLYTQFNPNDPKVAQWKHNLAMNKAEGIVHGIAENKPGREGSWAGKPCIVVGSGPSVERHVPALLELARGPHRDKVRIIGANRAFRYLPPDCFDYYMMIDYEARREWFDDAEEAIKASKCVLLQWVLANPMTLEYFPPERRQWFVGNINLLEVPDERKLDKLGFCMMGGSVSTSMLWFAYYYMAANPTLMVGFDHAFTARPMGNDIPACVYPGVPLNMDQEGLQIMEDLWTGAPTITSVNLAAQKLQNDAAALFARQANRRIINCTEAGILKNPDRMPLATAIQRFVVEGQNPQDDESFVELRRQILAASQGLKKTQKPLEVTRVPQEVV